MPAPEELGNLINNFDNHIDELKSNDYKEMSLCTDYLNPLFKLLGWDVDNSVGKAEKFRDVIQQYRLTIGGSSKAPDYLFKIGNTGVFFVEAKKPSVDIAKAKDPAFQLRRYGWNKKEIDVSILTDFETFSVYDCRLKPNADDDPRVGRMAMYTYKDFATKWDELYSLFARENVEKGSLDKLLKEGTVKGVKESVDETFLKMIEEWRDVLARNIALRNENLDVRGLNFAVQQTIDRIIFLRIAEDRGLESPNQLQALTNSGNIYGNLKKLYELADSRYNSGLFHFKSEKGIDTQPDTISMSLSIDDKVLKDMITNLYYPKSPFDFSAMPADILGQVYERFLGKVIRLTGGHQAKVEEKPEVRKAGGVYYTPTYIVDYIVQNTVGKLVEGKTPEQVAKLRILDPACGSGSFLIGAYQFLLDWHLDWYLSNDRDKWIKGKNPPICEQMSEGQRIFRLTTEKRKEILKNNIYGVDIDRQAVEVAKLNLLLKVLEQENNPDLFKHNQRALPDLGSNIKCGNSLIGNDFFNGKENLFNTDESWRINAFDWDKEFPSIIRYKTPSSFDNPTSLPSPSGRRCPEGTDEGVLNSNKQPHPNPLLKGEGDTNKPSPYGRGQGEGVSGRQLEDGFGFDAVIGNPPYVRIQNMSKYDSRYFSKYESAIGNFDIYCIFVEQSLLLSNINSYISFILPHRFFKTDYGEGLRSLLKKNNSLIKVVDFDGYYVFVDATINTCIIILNANSDKDHIEFAKINNPKIEFQALIEYLGNHKKSFDITEGEINKSYFSSDYWTFILKSEEILYNKLMLYRTLGGVDTKIIVGLQTSCDPVYLLKYICEDDNFFTLRSKLNLQEYKLEKPLLKPILRGANISKFSNPINSDMLIFPYEITNNKSSLITSDQLEKLYPNTWNYLCEFKTKLLTRADVNIKQWHEYPYPKNLTEFNKPKIMTTVLSSYNSFTLDLDGIFYFVGGGNAGVYGIQSNNIDYSYLLGLLNSKLLNWYHHKISLRCYQTAFSYGKRFIENLPIRTIDFANKSDVVKHDKMVALVETMLELNKRLRECSVPSDTEMIKRQIEHTDRQIDQLVYELYGLTDDEIRIVEESFADSKKK